VPKGPEEIIAFFFRTGSEVGGSVFLWNFGIHLLNYKSVS
jgi:hypothetical protein